MSDETLGERVSRAITHSTNPETQRSYTVPEISAALGGAVSTAWIYAVRNGEYQDASAVKLHALAKLLGVSVDWLISGELPPGRRDTELHRPEVRNLALRGGQLSPEVLQQLYDIMDILQRNTRNEGEE